MRKSRAEGRDRPGETGCLAIQRQPIDRRRSILSALSPAASTGPPGARCPAAPPRSAGSWPPTLQPGLEGPGLGQPSQRDPLVLNLAPLVPGLPNRPGNRVSNEDPAVPPARPRPPARPGT